MSKTVLVFDELYSACRDSKAPKAKPKNISKTTMMVLAFLRAGLRMAIFLSICTINNPTTGLILIFIFPQFCFAFDIIVYYTSNNNKVQQFCKFSAIAFLIIVIATAIIS